jgi:hypothetical protein
MISQQHNTFRWPEEETSPTPAEKKQVWTVIEKKLPWLKPLMRVVAVVLSIVGGFASIWVFTNNLEIDSGIWQLAFVVPLIGVFCAFLFQSMWAIVIVPVAFTLGALLANFLAPVGESGFAEVWEVVIVVIFINVIGALIGSGIYISLKARNWW